MALQQLHGVHGVCGLVVVEGRGSLLQPVGTQKEGRQNEYHENRYG